MARLPNGTAIILQTERDHLETDILVRRPSQGHYSLLASVNGEEVVFADNVGSAESGA